MDNAAPTLRFLVCVPFQESLGGLGQLPFGLVLWIDDGCDMVVEEVARNGIFEVLGEIAEGVIVSLCRRRCQQDCGLLRCM